MSEHSLAVPVYVGLSILALRHAARARRAESARRRVAATSRARGPAQPSNRSGLAPAVAALRRRRRGRSDTGVLADAVESIVEAMATGVPVVDAVAAATRGTPAGLTESLDVIVGDLQAGAPVARAFDRWATAPTAPDGAALVAAAFTLATETGVDPVAALRGVVGTLRDRQAAAREVRALATQARVSAGVIALAPVGFALVTAGLGGKAAAFLLGSPLGLACLVGGVGLDVVGWRWMRRITGSVR